ncbi:Septin-7 [Thelohanellus kitauei]|uniref:Septin n=1 Tax=Thelohanellus kitauei TaxID=669202 RepID=A0A0C2N003_THEKT|nr:Septin-7 [Thelohanellus kitauei]
MQPAKIISNVPMPEKYVGFADLPNQIFRHYAMEGFDFNLMVVGEPGLGKSTFINNLFMCDVYVDTKYPEPMTSDSEPLMDIRNSFTTIQEKGIKLRLNLIDTPGYGVALDNRSNSDKIVKYIDQKYSEYLDWEFSSARAQYRDSRIHCCLYFVVPSGQKLKPIDLEFLGKVHNKVNVVLAIGRADSLTPDDLSQFKKRILEELEVNNIKIYQFPQTMIKTLDDKEKVENYLNRSPFAVVSSNTTLEINGKHVRCRKYPWGVCDVENVQHSDFLPLRSLLLRTCTAHLINTTHNVFYEAFRSSNEAHPHIDTSDSSYKYIEEEKTRFASFVEEKKSEYKEKTEKYIREIQERISELEAGYKDRIQSLEADIANMPTMTSSTSVSTRSNKSNTKLDHENTNPDEKKKKKKIF